MTNTITGGEPWVTLYFWTQLNKTHVMKNVEPNKCEGWDFYSTTNLPSPLFTAFAECARRSGWR